MSNEGVLSTEKREERRYVVPPSPVHCRASRHRACDPCGLSEGLPVGLQLIGPQFSENMLFRTGNALEKAIGFDTVPERLRT